MAKGYQEQVGNKHTGYKHILTSLQRNKVMWQKVMSLASDQGQLSLLCLLAFQKSEFRNGKDDMRRREGGITCWEMQVVVAEMEGFPPPPGRGASLWFAISVVFNLRDKGSASPTLNHSLSWCSIHGKQHYTNIKPDWCWNAFGVACCLCVEFPHCI